MLLGVSPDVRVDSSSLRGCNCRRFVVDRLWGFIYWKVEAAEWDCKGAAEAYGGDCEASTNPLIHHPYVKGDYTFRDFFFPVFMSLLSIRLCTVQFQSLSGRSAVAFHLPLWFKHQFCCSWKVKLSLDTPHEGEEKKHFSLTVLQQVEHPSNVQIFTWKPLKTWLTLLTSNPSFSKKNRLNTVFSWVFIQKSIHITFMM